MKKILVTGAGGFIGSHLTELCVQKEYSVRAFVHYNSKNDWGWLEHSKIKDKIEILSGDIRDYDSVYKAMLGCEAVFHLAALIGIPYSYVSPLAYIRTNVEGTYNVLESAKQLEIENVLITSTSETYGTAQYVPIDELHPMVGQSPYSATKIAADQLAISYYRSFELPIKIIRPFNTYGPRQSARAIIPTIITQIMDGRKKLELGNLNPTRDLTFVKDTAKAYMEISKTDVLTGQITNVGMNEEISIKDLVNKICMLMNVKIKITEKNKRIRPDNSEVEKLRCNNKKLLKHTKWQPQYSLDKGLTETINWFQKNIEYYKSEIYNV